MKIPEAQQEVIDRALEYRRARVILDGVYLAFGRRGASARAVEQVNRAGERLSGAHTAMMQALDILAADYEIKAQGAPSLYERAKASGRTPAAELEAYETAKRNS